MSNLNTRGLLRQKIEGFLDGPARERVGKTLWSLTVNVDPTGDKTVAQAGGILMDLYVDGILAGADLLGEYLASQRPQGDPRAQ